MQNPYQPPRAEIGDIYLLDNNSGGGAMIDVPEDVKGWSWGAFLLNWIWSIGNSTWIGLLSLIPYVGFIMALYLGFKGRELAWRNKRWDSLEEFNRIQRRWSVWACIVVFGVGVVGILAAILIPIYAGHAPG
jgi:hypothetical protein